MSKKIHAERMNKVIHFIENNPDSEIDVNKLSKMACYSEYHFHRLFRSYTGESVYAYKKRLLLERSAMHLLHTDRNISDIAFKCGYENQSSFNKAFKKYFSYTPGQVRKQMISVGIEKLKPVTSGDMIMEPEIIETEDINVVCARKTGSYSESASEAWGKIMKFAYSNKLMGKNVKRIGISHDDPNITEHCNIRYDACIDIEANIESESDLRRHTIPGGRYVKFMHKGAYDNFQKTYSYIFNEWLPESKYKLRDAPSFEIYLNKDPRKTKPENLKTEIYIPVE